MSQRSAVISIRVTESEKQKIDARAKAKNLTTTAHAREIITGFDADAVAARAQESIEKQDEVLDNLTRKVSHLYRSIRPMQDAVDSTTNELESKFYWFMAGSAAANFFAALFGFMMIDALL